MRDYVKTVIDPEVTEEQVLYFRAVRGGLAGGGLDDAVVAARAIVGGQAQQESPALLALSQRTSGMPDAATLKSMLWEERSLVRTWGQRDTVHVYAAEDWSDVVAARTLWAQSGRRGSSATEDDLAYAREHLEAFTGPFTRKDLYEAVSPAFVESLSDMAEKARQEPMHFAAGRLIWHLAYHGDICTVFKKGNQQAYAFRANWLPDLHWPDELEPEAAAARLTKRYLAVYGPARIQDIGHFFGARLSDVRRWMPLLEKEDALCHVRCGEIDDLLVLKEDLDMLRDTPPTTARGWPVRLLPLWDSMLMGHADKRWTVPDEAERKLVWKKAAMVCAVVLSRGRIVATWSYKTRKKALDVQVQPLSGWQARHHKAAVIRESQRVAGHMGLVEVQVSFA